MCVSPARGLTPSLFQSPGEVDVLASPMSKTRMSSQNGRCSDDGANFLLHLCTSLPTSSLFNRHHYSKNRSFMFVVGFCSILVIPLLPVIRFFSCFIFVDTQEMSTEMSKQVWFLCQSPQNNAVSDTVVLTVESHVLARNHCGKRE